MIGLYFFHFVEMAMANEELCDVEIILPRLQLIHSFRIPMSFAIHLPLFSLF